MAGTAQTSVSQVTSQLPSATGSSVTTETGLKLNVEVEVQSARWGSDWGTYDETRQGRAAKCPACRESPAARACGSQCQRRQ